MDQAGNAVEHISGERIHIALPSAHTEPKCPVQNMIAELVVDAFQRGHSANHPIVSDLANGKRVGLHQIPDNELFLISGFDICHEHLIGL